MAVVDQKTGLRRSVGMNPSIVHSSLAMPPLSCYAAFNQGRLLCAADAGIIPSMRHTWTLIGLLAGLCLIGATTTQLVPAATEAGRIGWMLYLLVFPIALAGLVWIGWTWTAMACVIYGTVGLALDLATVTSILGGQGETGTLFLFSVMSGIVNFLLILFGGRAFLHSFQGDRASSIPPSQSSVPFFIRKTLIRSNPASVNQAFVSAAL